MPALCKQEHIARWVDSASTLCLRWFVRVHTIEANCILEGGSVCFHGVPFVFAALRQWDILQACVHSGKDHPYPIMGLPLSIPLGYHNYPPLLDIRSYHVDKGKFHKRYLRGKTVFSFFSAAKIDQQHQIRSSRVFPVSDKNICW